MGNREVPYEPNETCDICGCVGAYDFYGDFMCAKCADKALVNMRRERRREYSAQHKYEEQE